MPNPYRCPICGSREPHHEVAGVLWCENCGAARLTKRGKWREPKRWSADREQARKVLEAVRYLVSAGEPADYLNRY